MATTLPMQSPAVHAVRPPVDHCEARTALYDAPGAPPSVATHTDPDPAVVIQSVCDLVAGNCAHPPLAVREVVENLVHARMDGALISVLDDGSVVRVSDAGPGISDPARAREPGYTTAGPEERQFIRGVGAGLATAQALLASVGGRLDISDGLGHGTTVTLTVPTRLPARERALPEDARTLMALLLELDDATPERLAGELGVGIAACGRTLAELEHLGLVTRAESGVRALTPEGHQRITSLFS